MADLTQHVAPVCRTVRTFATKVNGTGVYYGEMPRGSRYRFNWFCDCGGEGVAGCEHITAAKGQRCGWNAHMEPYQMDGETSCPDCGGELEYMLVAV